VFAAVGQVLWIHSDVANAAGKVVAVNTREQRRIDNVGSSAVDNHLLVVWNGTGFGRRDEARAAVREIGTHGDRRKNVIAARDTAGEDQASVKLFTDLADQRERTQGTGMTAGAGAHGDDAVDALFHGLARVPHADDVVKYEAAIRMHGLHDFARRIETRDDNRHFFLDAGLDIGEQSRIARMRNLVDRKRGDRLVRVGLGVGTGFFLDLPDPVDERLLRPRVECRERADDAGFALFDDEFGTRNDEHRRPDQRHAQLAFEYGR
jgi:hypothetical protein